MFTQMRERTPDKVLQAYIERRSRLWSKIVKDNPSYSETEVVARLEQFGE